MSDVITRLHEKHRELSGLGITNFSIAGGYIRDLYAGFTPVDIDLFFDDQDSFVRSVECLEYQAKKIKQRKNSVVFRFLSGVEVDLVFCDGNCFGQCA